MTLAQTTPMRLDPHLIYLADAAVSLTMGVALLLGAGAITELAGWPLPPAFLTAVGIFLLPWAAFNLWIGRSAQPNRAAVVANLIGDALWIAGTAALLVSFAPTLTAIGLVLLAGQGLAVVGVLITKLFGARALIR